MFSLLLPAALFGLSLLAIPIVIHLLKPRRARRMAFSSLRWLHVTQQRLTWRIRSHQLLLLLLRSALIILLVLAVAKPIFNFRAASGPRERFVVLDVGRSMGYRHEGRPTPFETGKRLAATLLTGGGSGDRTALLATGNATRVLGALVKDGQRHIPLLTPLEPGLTDTDLGSSLEKINSLLSQRRDNAEVELYFITDNHQGCWQQGTIESFLNEVPGKVRAVVVDVADPAPRNGWIAACRLDEQQGGNRRSLLVQVRCVGPAQNRTVRLSGLSGQGDRLQSVLLEPGRPKEVRFELPPDYQARGQAARISLEPPDDLPSDDQWIYLLDPQPGCRVLLVEGASLPGDPNSAGFALRTAIESLSTSEPGIHLTSKKYDDIRPQDFRDVDAVLWANVPRISEAALHVLEQRVQQGLGLGVFLGPGVDQEFYNGRLFKPIDHANSLLPVALDRIEKVPAAQGGLAPWTNIDWHHPLFAGLFDPSLGDLAQANVSAYYRLKSLPFEGDEVLATVAAVPAVIEHPVGAGRVVLFNTTANDAWGDLSRRNGFVPLVDRLINDLSGGVTRRNFLVGESIKLLTTAPARGETITVLAPNGSTLTPTTIPVGQRTLLRLPGLRQPGVYQVQRSGASNPDFSFVVQTGRGDSQLVETSPDLLRAWWQPAEFALRRGDVSTESPGFTVSYAVLSAWLALAAALVLALETFLANWYCPRAIPALAPSVIQQRRLSSARDSTEVKAPAN